MGRIQSESGGIWGVQVILKIANHLSHKTNVLFNIEPLRPYNFSGIQETETSTAIGDIEIGVVPL